MTVGELTVLASIWVALIAYAAGPLATLVGRDDPRMQGRLRAIWTLGCAGYLMHAISAFHVHYQWSHAIALRETARETAEVVGREAGGGLYLNYLLAGLWLADVVWCAHCVHLSDDEMRTLELLVERLDKKPRPETERS